MPPSTWKDLLPPDRYDTVTWDFTPFLEAPVVQSKCRENGEVHLLNIPKTKIPSPLANNLSPRQVMDIKGYLVGKDGDSGCGGNGKEIWLSWKRAWDIWNNYYIEGRVNPVWVREEWERRELAQKEWNAERDERRWKREKAKFLAVRGHPPVNPEHDPLLPEGQVPRPKPPQENKPFRVPTDLGNDSPVSGWATGDHYIRFAEWDPEKPNTQPSDIIGDDEKWLKIGTESVRENVKASYTWVLVNKNESDHGSENAKKPLPSSLAKNKLSKPQPTTTLPPKAPTIGARHHAYVEDEKEEDGKDDVEMLELPEDCWQEGLIDDHQSDSDSQPPPKRTTNDDGSSGGWWPLKEIAEYYEPEEDKHDGKVWVDAVANTIWRPRRVGEKKLKIALDEDFEAFCKHTEFRVDGGVDCGRSPFPVLRPVTQHVRTPENAFRKKAAWDGVTGTLFNMPTQPLEPCPETRDEKKQRIKDMYSDPIRDNPHCKDFKLYPLDIRRVLKVAPGLEKPREICDEGEELVRDPTLYPQKKYRDMKLDDPWWVTDSQRLARDAPPYRHPPCKNEEISGESLPLDGQLWKEEVDRDLQHDAGYFATNLHGGTLIINGMEIRKGDVAGPLPEFAIIKCPGGQIAFWWGVGGRHYGHGMEDVDHSAKWNTLRQHDGGWEHVAMTAGEVWDAKIRDRKEREKTGENEDDDEEWERWKRAKKADPRPDDKDEEPRQPGRYNPIPKFDSDIDELKWLNVQEVEKKRMLDVNSQAASMIYPKDDSFWPGTAPRVKLSHEVSRTEKDRRWEVAKDIQLARQAAVNSKVEEERVKRRLKEREKEKRKAGENLQSARKKRKIANQMWQDAKDKAQKEEKDAEDAENIKTLTRIRDARRKAEEKRARDIATQTQTQLNQQALWAQRDTADKKSREDAAAFAHSIEGKLDALRKRYYALPDGPAKVRAAQAYIDRYNAPQTKPEANSYASWMKSLTPKQYEDQQKIFNDATWTLVKAKEAKLEAKAITTTTTKPPQTTRSTTTTALPPKLVVKSKPLVIKIEPADAKTATTYPSTVNTTLQHAVEEADQWDDPELQKAILLSYQTFETESHESLKVRATSTGLTENQYAQTQGYDTAAEYLAAQRKNAEIEEQKPPPSPERIKTEAGKSDVHIESYKDDMREAIREGIIARSKHHKFDFAEAYAGYKGKGSVRDWVEETLRNMSITLDMIPSRKKLSEMSDGERMTDKIVWRAWCERINAAADWKSRIRDLPKGPSWSDVKFRGNTKYCVV